MKRFQFPLDRVLAWRQTQADIEEAKLQGLMAKLKALRETAAALESGVAAAEQELAAEIGKRQTVNARELVQLANYRLGVRRDVLRLAAEQQQVQRGLEQQRAILTAARRKCRLLERLKQKARGQWEREYSRELESLAGDLHLARWKPPPEEV